MFLPAPAARPGPGRSRWRRDCRGPQVRSAFGAPLWGRWKRWRISAGVGLGATGLLSAPPGSVVLVAPLLRSTPPPPLVCWRRRVDARSAFGAPPFGGGGRCGGFPRVWVGVLRGWLRRPPPELSVRKGVDQKRGAARRSAGLYASF
jgi:hypothetical protein